MNVVAAWRRDLPANAREQLVVGLAVTRRRIRRGTTDVLERQVDVLQTFSHSPSRREDVVGVVVGHKYEAGIYSGPSTWLNGAAAAQAPARRDRAKNVIVLQDQPETTTPCAAKPLGLDDDRVRCGCETATQRG